MEIRLISLNETNVLKTFILYNYACKQPLETVDGNFEVNWILKHWDDIDVAPKNGQQESKGLIQLNFSNIVKILCGCQTAMEEKMHWESMGLFVLNIFDTIAIKNKGYFSRGNEIYLTDKNNMPENNDE